MGRLSILLATGLLLSTAAVLGSCGEDVTCGAGTIEVQGECVPLLPANCTGPGVRFDNGICVADNEGMCGPGTRLTDAGVCVGTGDIPDAGPDVDTSGDVEPDAVEFDPECGDDLVGGEQVCMWGRVFDFITLEPAPGDADPPLEVQVKDLLLALPDRTNPEAGLLADTRIQDDGWFSLPSFDLQESPTRPLIIILGEEEDVTDELESVGEVWQRSIGGLINSSTTATEYPNLTFFIVQRAHVESWNTELGLGAGEGIDDTGFMLVRIVDAATGDPIEGATFLYLGSLDASIRYFGDDETSFQPDDATTTGESGLVLLRGTGTTDACNVEAPGYISEGQFTCGVSEQRASLLQARMITE